MQGALGQYREDGKELLQVACKHFVPLYACVADLGRDVRCCACTVHNGASHRGNALTACLIQ